MQNPIIYKHISKRTNKLYNIYEKKNEKRDKRKNQQLYIFFKHMDKNYKSTVTLINA